MPSLFARAAGVAGRTVERVYGEGFLLSPLDAPRRANGRVDVNAGRSASATRPERSFRGTFVARGAVMHPQGRALAETNTHAVVAEQPMVDVLVDAFGPPTQAGDRILRLDTGEVFEVAKWVPGDFGHAWIHLTEAVRAQA